MLNNKIYLPGEVLFISDIGPQPVDRSDPGSTLVCVTSSINTACCNNKTVVEWFYPNCTTVPHGDESSVIDFATFHYTTQIRLAREVDDSAPPVGVYTCEVSDISTGTIYNASITIQIGKFTVKIMK